jgi:hypothetical protein
MADRSAFNLPLVESILDLLPWPQGVNAKVVTLARRYRPKTVARIFRLEDHNEDHIGLESTWVTTRCAWFEYNRVRGDKAKCAVLMRFPDIDLSFPDSAGRTFLLLSAQRGRVGCANYLLDQNADPNAQDDHGRTALHLSKDSSFVGRLLNHPLINPCLYNEDGQTPYMAAHGKDRVDLLRPHIPFEAIEIALKQASPGLQAAALHGLCTSGVLELRLPDLLFCCHEGGAPELARRRLALWQLILEPMMEEATKRPFSKTEKSIFMYSWEASAGPPNFGTGARSGYAEQLQIRLTEVMQTFSKELDPVRSEILQDPFGAALARRPPTDIYVEASEDMRHSRFLNCSNLGWAVEQDLCAAARELQSVGALKSADELCDILLLGRHPLIGPSPRRDIFCTRSQGFIESVYGPLFFLLGLRSGIDRFPFLPFIPSPTFSLGTALHSSTQIQGRSLPAASIFVPLQL